MYEVHELSGKWVSVIIIYVLEHSIDTISYVGMTHKQKWPLYCGIYAHYTYRKPGDTLTWDVECNYCGTWICELTLQALLS